MKKTVVTALISLTTLLTNAQPAPVPEAAIEDWYGFIRFIDGFIDEIVLHIPTRNAATSVTVDFPLKNIGSIWRHEPYTAVEARTVTVSESRVAFMIPALRIDFDATRQPSQSELLGQLVIAGHPHVVRLSRQRTPPPDQNPTYIEPIPGLSEADLSPDRAMPRTIDPPNTVFAEELNWLEIRDALRAGKTTILIPTGGVEMNGRYLASGKHNYVLRVATDSMARKLGNTLIAPIVPFVPEGQHNPPTGHMRYPGTISLTEATFESLLREIALSYKMHGFKTIIFIGDSGGNQWGMYVVAKELNAAWKSEGFRVLYIPEYYDNFRVAQWLKTQGINEKDSGTHDSFQYTAQIMALDPALVRASQRIKAGNFSINGVNLQPISKTIEMGKKLADYQAEVTVEAIRKALVAK